MDIQMLEISDTFACRQHIAWITSLIRLDITIIPEVSTVTMTPVSYHTQFTNLQES